MAALSISQQQIDHEHPQPPAKTAQPRQNSTLFDTSVASAKPAAPPPPAPDPSAGSSLFDTSPASADSTAAQPTVNQVQFRVAAALASGKSATAAAADAGLHRSTIYKWLDNSPVFKRLFETASRDYVETLRDGLRDLSALALATIEDLMTNPKTPASVRLRAALAVLTRPQFPNPGWSLPERIDPDYQRHLQDQLAAVHADYDIMRMSRSMAASAAQAMATHHKSTEKGQLDRGAFLRPPNSDLRSPAVHHKSTEGDTSAGMSSAQPARNALCPCGSGKKYKRCCGQSAPPVISGFKA